MEDCRTEAEDPVVNEVDVFVSQSLADSLCLLQYPLRPAHISYNSNDILSARFRPTQQRIELDIGVRCRGTNYSTSRGENYAKLVELGSRVPSSDDKVYESGLWDKYTISSDNTPITSPRYVAAVFKDNELHLTPLHAIIQMRPSLSHLDKADTGAKKAAAAAVSGGDGGGDTTGSEGEEAKPVVVKFARRDSKVKGQQKGIGRKMNFQEAMEKHKSSEAWITVDYKGVESEEACEERRLLFAERDDQMELFSQTAESYVDSVCPRTVTQETTPTVAMPTGVLSLADLKSLPLSQQVVKLLRNAHMIQFGSLCSMLGVMGGGVVSVCEAVRGCAVLVQGCWVVSSQQIFPGEENLLKRNSRDYILWCFTQHRFVPRKDIVGVVKLSPEVLREMLQQLAVPKVDQQQGWEFKLPTDFDFAIKFPTITQEQKESWRQRHEELVMELGIRLPGGGMAKHSDPALSGQLRFMSGEQLIKNAQKMSQAIAMETAAALKGTDAPQQVKPDELVKPDPELLEALVDFCSKAVGWGVLSLREVRNRLLLKQATLARKSRTHVLTQHGVSDKLLEEGLSRCGAIEVGQPCNKRLFALSHGDPCREATLKLFQSHESLRKKQLLEELNNKGLKSDVKVVSTILKELCYSKGGHSGLWRLLGT